MTVTPPVLRVPRIRRARARRRKQPEITETNARSVIPAAAGSKANRKRRPNGTVPPRSAETLQEKDAVRVGVEVEPWLKPADRIVARFAQDNGGIYDPVRHQRELVGMRQSTPGNCQPTPAERVA